MMLRDYIGTDLSRLYNEIDKLALILGLGAMITPESIERNIGISKDYNNFELIDAINSRNAAKVFKIVDYFTSNPKNNPTVMTVSTLFNHFSNLLIYHYTRDKSPSGYMDALGFRNTWQLKPYETAARPTTSGRQSKSFRPSGNLMPAARASAPGRMNTPYCTTSCSASSMRAV